MLKLGNTYLKFGVTYLTDWDAVPNPNPFNLPANTIRVKFKSGYTPDMGNSRTLVDSTSNVWDIYKSSNNWSSLFSRNSNLLEIIGANTSNITNMGNMFRNCTSLTSVALFDTSNVNIISDMFYGCSKITSVPLFDTGTVTTMSEMFYGCSSLTYVPLFNTRRVVNMMNVFNGCSSLTYVPLFNTSKVIGMYCMFYNCTKVQGGALALYQQASSQTTPPSDHEQTFYNCGSNTPTGAAELAQIPSDWK